MKRIGMISSVVVLSLAFAAQAESKRYLVVMKSPRALTATASALKGNTHWSQAGVEGARALKVAQSIREFNGQVQQTLSRLNTLVVESSMPADLNLLRANPAVLSVEEEVFHPAPPHIGTYQVPALNHRVFLKSAPQSAQFKEMPSTPWGIGAVRARDAWTAAHSGAGARVLVLDTGIDKDHPSLAANFEEGQDFVNDALPRPYPFADLVGHGTHVAGTIAGVADEGGFTGVAPQARILSGRVCSTRGCSNVSIAQGINWGIEKKVDVINMSLGGFFSTPGEREAIRAAYQAGVTIVAASGNDGTSRVSYPAALPQSIAVGAVDSHLQRAQFSQYGPELAVVAPGVEVVSSVPQGTGRASNVQIKFGEGAPTVVTSAAMQGGADVPQPIINTLVYAGLGRPGDFETVDVAGKFALIQRGEITFLEKVQNALKAGAAGALIFNNAPGLINGALTQDGSRLAVPVFMIEQAAGDAIVQALTVGTIVQSEVVVVATNYSAFNGTSMATPHVAGVVALIKAAQPGLRPGQVRDILQRTATALGPNANNEFGAGLVNAQAAVDLALQTTPATEEAPLPEEPVVPSLPVFPGQP